MNNPETTNLLLMVLTLVTLGQFILLVAVIVSMRAAVNRAKLAMSMLVGSDVHQVHMRFAKLLSDIELLVARGNTIFGAMERGAQDLGAVATVMSHKAQSALALGAFEARALSMAFKSGLRWFLNRRGFARDDTSVNGRPAATQAAAMGGLRSATIEPQV